MVWAGSSKLAGVSSNLFGLFIEIICSSLSGEESRSRRILIRRLLSVLFLIVLFSVLLLLFINDDISSIFSVWVGDISENSRARGRRCFFIIISFRNKVGGLFLLVY